MAVKPTPVIERVLRRVVVDDLGCWIFTGAIDPATGYGRIGAGSRTAGVTATHRVTYADHWGGIPEGKHIDHLCRNRACCNPTHLEAVTQAANNQRSWDARHGSVRRFADQYANPSRAYLALLTRTDAA
jgi:hypothetical protein